MWFPLGINGDIPDNPPCKNHNGTTQVPESVEAYIAVELVVLLFFSDMQEIFFLEYCLTHQI